jgi:putative ABC transport system permease protein
LFRDVQLAIRRLWFKPAHTGLMVLIIGVGIGAATAVFSVVDQTILRPPPFPHADRLVEVLDLFRSAGARSTNLTVTKIAGWQAQPALFEAFEGYRFRQVDIAGTDIEPERLRGLIVTNGLLPMLGVQPMLGRGFTAEDGKQGAERVVLISEQLWRRKFSARADVLGTRIALSDEQYAIVGVMPRRFRLTGDDEDLWFPINVNAAGPDAPANFVGLARVARSVDPASQQKLADTLAARMQQQAPLPNEPFWDIHLGKKKVATVTETTETALFVLLAAVGFVLLIACANTASLFMAQIAIRQHETAIRAAIGATRGRLFREVLTESVLLAACGGGVGVLLATWGVDAIVAAAPPNLTFNATSPIEVDARVLAVAAGMTLTTGVVFGLLPAMRGSRANLEWILKAARGAGTAAYGRVSATLIVAEIAFSLILLVGAALMIRTFMNLQAIAPGFELEGLVAMEVSLPTDKYVGEGSRSAFFDAVRERLVGTPGVSDVAIAAGVFRGGGTHYGTPEVEGDPVPVSDQEVEVPFKNVAPEFFRTLQIPLVAGRTFTAIDASDAVIVSKSLADRLVPGGGPIGRRFRLGRTWQWETIVGVVGDIEPRAGGNRTPFYIYRRLAPAAAASGPPPRVRGYATRVVIVRASQPSSIVPAMRAAVWASDRNQPTGPVTLVDDLYNQAFARERFVLQLMSVFGAIAIALTAAGIFAVLSQLVARRTREIGVRMALGARAADIVRLIVSRGVVLLAIGTVCGLAGAAALTRYLEALLFQVRPVDPVSFIVVTLLLGVTALLACWLPTRRAMRVDPAVALRVE